MASWDFGKKEVRNYLCAKFPKGSTCLDVGACDGKWREVLGDHFKMDAVEAFTPNAERIAGLYEKVFNVEVEEFRFEWYDCVVMGDVVEHMMVGDAIRALKYIYPRCRELVVAIPYFLPQGAIYGNPYEVHRQPELTHEVFMRRYPGFVTLLRNNRYGYYIKG